MERLGCVQFLHCGSDTVEIFRDTSVFVCQLPVLVDPWVSFLSFCRFRSFTDRLCIVAQPSYKLRLYYEGRCVL